jgi:uncharacterized protein HemX
MKSVLSKPKMIGLVILVLLLAGGAVYYFKQKEAEVKTEEKKEVENKEEEEPPKEPAVMDAKMVAIQQDKADKAALKKQEKETIKEDKSI